jgi:type I restriction enzyme S subunit
LGQSIFIPTYEEQQAIASYLDKKCGKINGAIDVQKKKIDLLNELKQTIITNAVTKGLNPDAPMKDSGVEWIGEIPEHWKIMRTRFLCNIQTGDKDTVNREDDGLYPFYVRSPKVERINTYSFDGEAVLMAGDGVGAGKVFHYANGKFDYHQRVYNLHNFKDVSGLFFYYYILNKFRYIIEEGAAKNTVDSVRLNMIQDFWMTIPPVFEQQNIVKYIDGEISKIDAQISKANRRIELLNELKQSVITEAVTGKIKVI